MSKQKQKAIYCKVCRHLQHYAQALRPPTGDSEHARRVAAWVHDMAQQREQEEEIDDQ